MELVNLTPEEAIEALVNIEARLEQYKRDEFDYLVEENDLGVTTAPAYFKGYDEAVCVVSDMITDYKLEIMAMRGQH